MVTNTEGESKISNLNWMFWVLCADRLLFIATCHYFVGNVDNFPMEIEEDDVIDAGSRTFPCGSQAISYLTLLVQ